MYLNVLTEKLKIDVGDSTLGWYTLARCFERAVVQLNKDLGTGFVIGGSGAYADTTITPDPTTYYIELLMILAQMHLVGMGRLGAAGSFTYRSGDKAIDKTRMALSHTELVNSLWQQYLNLAGLDRSTIVCGAIYNSDEGDYDWTPGRTEWLSF